MKAARAAAADNRPMALATVIAADGSAPRGVGAQLLIESAHRWTGALSGGCTEQAVIDIALELMSDGYEPGDAKIVTYRKQSIEDVGPDCGSTLAVLVERMGMEHDEWLDDIDDYADRGVTFVTEATLEADIDLAEPGSTTAARIVRHSVVPDPTDDDYGTSDVEIDGQHLEFVHNVGPPLRLVICGAGDLAIELTHGAARLGWHTTIIDPRTTVLEHTLTQCTPDASLTDWPAEGVFSVGHNTAAIALAHESRIDDPFVEAALTGCCQYVGAVGSRASQASRRTRLSATINDMLLDTLRAPAGIDLGGGTAPEIALSILAEITAVTSGRSGRPLVDTTGPIRAR